MSNTYTGLFRTGYAFFLDLYASLTSTVSGTGAATCTAVVVARCSDR
jgi:hypothetical protein